MISLNLTVHNKSGLIDYVLGGILHNTVGEYELIIVLDGCTDKSKDKVLFHKDIYDHTGYIKIFEAPNVFETKANNIAAKNSIGDHIIIIQDDMVITEGGWNERLLKPFKAFDDIFAVTARTAHNWEPNSNSIHINEKENRDDCWSDVLFHTNHANKDNLGRNLFGVRDCVNRGPLAIRRDIFEKMGGFDEAFAPLQNDDHDFCYRTYKATGMRCGCYPIGFTSKDEWGGTRKNGKPKPFMFQADHKNSKILWERHKDLIKKLAIGDENRRL
jgi:glycosyltransferase involved in cell wall biosynthesis